MSYDIDAVSRALLNRCPAILSEWLPGGNLRGHTYTAADPCGNNGKPIKVNVGSGKWGNWSEGVTGGSLIALYCYLHGRERRGHDFALSLKELAAMCGIAETKTQVRIARSWELVLPVPDAAYECDDEGNPRLPKHPRTEQATAFWPYYSKESALQCFRFRVNHLGKDGNIELGDDGKPKKDVFPLTYRRDRTTGELAWHVLDLPAPRPLYNLPAVADDPERVLIVEGEKVADAAQRLMPNWAVITWPGGVERVRTADWSPVVSLPAGTRIVLWPDADKSRVGVRAMSDVAEILARPVEIVTPDPAWPDKYDIADLAHDGWPGSRVIGWIDDHAVRMANTGQQRIPLQLYGRDVWTQMKAVYAALHDSGAELFAGADGPVYLRENSDGIKEVRALSPPAMRCFVTKYVDTYWQNGTGRHSAPISDQLAEEVVHFSHEHLPALRRFVECPVFTPDGRFLEVQGFDAASGTYLELPSGYNANMPLPDAMELIDDVLADFMFVSSSDRTHAFAYPLTFIMRDLIDGSTPLWRFEASTPRTGKGLLCEVLTHVISPWLHASTIAKDPDEVRKDLFSKIRFRPPVIVMDNAETLEFTHLKSMLTERYVEQRLLGKNEVLRASIDNLWAVTINNPVLSKELIGRSIRVRIDSRMENPDQRSGFRHAELSTYVRQNRGALVSAFCAIAKHGVSKTLAKLPPFGRYEPFVSRMAPVLYSVGLTGFLDTHRDDERQAIEPREQAMKEFVGRWAQEYGINHLRSTDLRDIANAVEFFPGRRDKDGHVTPETVGRTLRAMTGRVFDTDSGSVTVNRSTVKAGHSEYWLEGIAGAELSATPQSNLFSD